MEILPNFLQQGIPTNYDNSIERTSIQECHPSATNFALGSQINFTYDGSELYRLSSNRTGFRCTFTYVTQSGNSWANDMGANITLASNFFSNYYNKMSILVGNKEIESFSDPGIIANILSNIKESEYREKHGALHSFVPDTGTAQSNDIPVAASWTSGAQFVANTAQNQTVTYNAAYNHGYLTRKELYNYTVANNDTARSVQFFIPLNALFGNLKENDKVLKYIKFTIQLMITQNNLLPRCYYGAANTGVVFTGADRGLRSIVLELELLYPRPEILLDLEKEFSKELRFSYLTRYIEPIGNAIGIQRTYTHRQAFSKANQGLPK